MDPEQALRKTNAKFRKRFAYVEKHASLPGATLAQMEALWQAAKASEVPSRKMIDIRPLTEREDLKSAVRLQRQIWGFEDVDLIPLRLFVVATKIGGQVFGAFDGAQMIGFLPGDSRPQTRRQNISAQPHAGRAAGLPQRGRGPHRSSWRSATTRWRAASI